MIPCTVKLKDCVINAKFHKWVDHAWVVAPSIMVGGAPGGQMAYTTGLVEYEDGTMHEVEPTSICFSVGGTKDVV